MLEATLSPITSTQKKLLDKWGNSLKNYCKKQKGYPSKPIFSIRELLKEIPELLPLCINDNLKRILSTFDKDLFLTKALFFNKTPNANWYVTWHQDTPINVKEKIETDKYHGWTSKEGITSVIPPEHILQESYTIRIHLDDTNEDNGALRIIPGSHKKIHDDQSIHLITQSSLDTISEVQAGGIQIMKPLLLHASSKAPNQKQRRVIHLEFNQLELDGQLGMGREN